MDANGKMSVLIVDDQQTAQTVLAGVVGGVEGVEHVHTCGTPIEALDILQRETVDLIVTDFRMPQMDGAAFTRLVRAMPEYEAVPVIVVTIHDARDVRLAALHAGATDFLTKPLDYAEATARIRNLLRLHRLTLELRRRGATLETKVRDAVRDVSTREHETIDVLAKAGEMRDTDTGFHIARMRKYSGIIAAGIGLNTDEAETIEVASAMHDIGKIGISDMILLKPGRHTDAESALMRAHTMIGYQILRKYPSKYLSLGATIALSHHERFDGTGYPNGVTGEQIPIAARIVAVADVFDALTSERPYKRAWSIADAEAYLYGESGKHFDPACVDAFRAQRNQILDVHYAFQDGLPPRSEI